MKHLRTYAILEKFDNNLMDIVTKIREHDYEYIENILKNKLIDVNSTVGSAINVPLIGVVQDIGMLELLTKYGADWYKKEANGDDFIDRLENSTDKYGILKYIKWKHPEKYQEHRTRKDAEKYNL